MKRQQVISRFFTPKGASSSPDKPSGSPDSSVPKKYPSPISIRPPVTSPTVSWRPRGLPGGSSSTRSLREDFSFSPSRKRPLEDAADPSEESVPSVDIHLPDSILASGNGHDGSLKAAPLRKKRTLAKNALPVQVSHHSGWESLDAIETGSKEIETDRIPYTPELVHPESVDNHIKDENVDGEGFKELVPESDISEGENESRHESTRKELKANGPSQPPEIQKRRPWQRHEEVMFPAIDATRHEKFVDKLLARSDERGAVQEAWYGKPPTGKVTYTPLEQQVVELKARYPDVVLLIEVGYKYKFFGNDAETAARVLGIFAYYKHNFLNASIPTFRLHVHVRRLVEAGYKVGVVRQTETAAIKSHGANKTGPFTRGLSALYTRATLEAAEDLGGEVQGRVGRLNSYLMCIAEQPLLQGFSKSKVKKPLRGKSGSLGFGEDEKASYYDTQFGVVAVEIATGDIMFGDFNDTVMRSELEVRLLTCSPAELLLGTPLSSATEKLVLEFAGPGSDIRVERISRDCFKDGGALAEVMNFYNSKSDQDPSHSNSFPEGEMASEEEKVDPGLEAVMAMPDIVLQALALALRYLRQFGLENVLRLGASFRPFAGQSEMSLSPNALQQLEILKNADGIDKGSLLWLMDHTQTAFGARLLRHWVSPLKLSIVLADHVMKNMGLYVLGTLSQNHLHPLSGADEEVIHPLLDHGLIAARLDAVTEIAESMGSVGVAQGDGSYPGSGKGGGYVGALIRGQVDSGGKGGRQGLLASLLTSLGKLPDVQRGITRIFLRTATAAEFVSVIQALILAARQLRRLHLHEEQVTNMDGDDEGPKGVRCALLRRLLAAASSMAMSEHAAQLLSALNTDAAASGDKLNLFLCKNGRFSEVAECRVAIKAVEQQLEELLPSLRKLLRMPRLEYLTVAVTTHLVEVPVAQRVPADWIKINSTKKMNRFHPPEVLQALDALALAKEELSAACGRAWDSFLAEFASHYVDFRAAVQALAALDCLHSLAIVSRNQGYTRPEFVEDRELSQLMINAGRHPVLESTLQDGFVPNDTFLHTEKERCQIITGPNMGGKSCYIRQVALIAIMAQVGSYVPATSAKLHVLDAVFTRMGASDSIQKGTSTFFEELSEASAILLRATSRSLVIIDELGRGTSTHDGVAIAYATLHHILKETRCLTLFVTHYPKIAELKDEFPGKVSPYFVSYLAENPTSRTSRSNPQASMSHVLDNYKEPEYAEEATQKITFLYKLVPGVASRSFGLHVAHLAQVPDACVLQAAAMAEKLEKEVTAREQGKSSPTRKFQEDDMMQVNLGSSFLKLENDLQNAADQDKEMEIRCNVTTFAKGSRSVQDEDGGQSLDGLNLEELAQVMSLFDRVEKCDDSREALTTLKEARDRAKMLL